MTDSIPADSPPRPNLGERLAEIGRALHADHTCVSAACQCLCGCKELIDCTLLFGPLCAHCTIRQIRSSDGLHAFPGTEDLSEHVALALARAAQAYPQQRAMQIIFNALDAQGLARHADRTPRDMFFADNATLTRALRRYTAAAPAARPAAADDPPDVMTIALNGADLSGSP